MQYISNCVKCIAFIMISSCNLTWWPSLLYLIKLHVIAMKILLHLLQKAMIRRICYQLHLKRLFYGQNITNKHLLTPLQLSPCVHWFKASYIESHNVYCKAPFYQPIFVSATHWLMLGLKIKLGNILFLFHYCIILVSYSLSTSLRWAPGIRYLCCCRHWDSIWWQ